jgi:hypothetical protein
MEFLSIYERKALCKAMHNQRIIQSTINALSESLDVVIPVGKVRATNRLSGAPNIYWPHV